MSQSLSIKAMTPEVIEARLTYQKPTPEQVAAMQELNEKFVELGRSIGKLCPEGMMKSRAVTDLVLLRMVANAAVVGDGIPAGSLAGTTRSDGPPEKPSEASTYPEHVGGRYA